MTGRIVAICGGVGGAKLAYGLYHALPAGRLTVIVNTGDDFRHFGLLICPDLDTVTYTLADMVNRETGWGRRDESWHFMDALRKLGGEVWFNLGDRDLAMHAVRTAGLEAGERLTAITAGITARLGIAARILPVSDDAMPTELATDEGILPFQHYFVARRCEPRVRGVRLDSASRARLTPEVSEALQAPDLSAIILCPSNPYLSIDPMLAVPGFRQLLASSHAPVIAVSPIVGGKALKGPLAKMMEELGKHIAPQTVADHYAGLVDLFVVDQTDRDKPITGPKVHFRQTVMNDQNDRVELAREVLALAEQFLKGQLQ